MKIEKMNKHVRAIIVMVVLSYFVITPYLAILYGVGNNIQGFNSGVEFHEMYGVLATYWFLGHVVLVASTYSLYMVTYGMWKE